MILREKIIQQRDGDRGHISVIENSQGSLTDGRKECVSLLISMKIPFLPNLKSKKNEF